MSFPGAALVKAFTGFGEAKPDYMPWNIGDIKITVGAPPIHVQGLKYVFARHNVPQTQMIMSLTGKGVFASNKNNSGIIEFALLRGVEAGAVVQVLDYAGIPYPISVVDTATGGSSMAAGSACRLVGTPEWRREMFPGFEIYTFATVRLLISTGARLLAS